MSPLVFHQCEALAWIKMKDMIHFPSDVALVVNVRTWFDVLLLLLLMNMQ